MDDKTTNKISIKKFQEVYNAIAAENPSSVGGYGIVSSISIVFQHFARCGL